MKVKNFKNSLYYKIYYHKIQGAGAFPSAEINLRKITFDGLYTLTVLWLY